MSPIPNNVERVRERIRHASAAAERDPESITLVAVSKTRSVAEIREAIAAGLSCFGENYLQEALDKIDALRDLSPQWHYIGQIQSNKTRAITENFDWVHTVDRERVARRLSAQRPASRPPLNVCLQINVDREDSKAGTTPDQLAALARLITGLPGLRLRGLMAIPAPRNDPEAQLAVCRTVFDHYCELQREFPEVDTLSLGMSADLEAAIAAGSTMLRIGTDIFGPRQAQPAN